MIVTLQTQRVQSLEQVCAFLEGNEAVDFVEGDREGVYDLVRRTLVKLRYHRLGKPGKGLVKRYLGKVTGLSRAQHTRPMRGAHRGAPEAHPKGPTGVPARGHGSGDLRSLPDPGAGVADRGVSL